MKRMQQTINIESRNVDLGLTDKPVYRDQTLADRIDGEEKTFERDGAEQGGTLWRNKTWSRDLITIQSQPCLGYGPDSLLSASDYDVLRASGLDLKLFCQRSRHHTKRSTSVHKKLDFFNTPRRTGQLALYVEQSHIKSLLKNSHCSAANKQRNNIDWSQKGCQPEDPPAEQADQVRIHNVFQDSQADRPDDPVECAGAGG